MLDIIEIENTIQELENADTTFDTCIKLSALYNVRDHLKDSTQTMIDTQNDDVVVRELSDVLPHYKKYVSVKQAYQLGTGNANTVEQSFSVVCREIQEFIFALYSGTDMQEERFLLYNGIQELLPKIVP